jgi:hypothetical protein
MSFATRGVGPVHLLLHGVEWSIVHVVQNLALAHGTYLRKKRILRDRLEAFVVARSAQTALIRYGADVE